MTERLYLHVGGPKSGTTYLQGLLRSQRELLASHGVLVGGQAQVELVHAAMVLRDDRRLQDLPERAHGAWDRLVAEVRDWQGPSAVLSYELFSNLTAEQAQRAVADLEGIEVHVVVTARDLGRALASAWQERLKFGLDEPLATWQPPSDTVVGSEWGWRTLDPASVAARWSAGLPAERVHLVTVPRDGGPDALWHRFAEACDLQDVPVGTDAPRANESLDPAAAELLRRLNPLLGDFLRTGRDHAVWSRDLLANRVLAGLGREPLRAGPAQLAEAEERYAACVEAVTAAGYTLHGDLDDLRPLGDDTGRGPDEVDDAELLDTALRALAGLLREVRADAETRAPRPGPVPPPSGPPAPRGPRALARRAATFAAGVASRPVLDRNAELHRRVDELEALLDDRRRLQQRLAMLTDLVTELLLPAEQASPEQLEQLVTRYRRSTV